MAIIDFDEKYPVKDTVCECCCKLVDASWQITLSPCECGQERETTFWECPNCGFHNSIPSIELSVLDAEFIG